MTRQSVKPLRLSLSSEKDESGWDDMHEEENVQRQVQGAKDVQRKMDSKVDGRYQVDLERLRTVAKASLDKNLHDNAIFLANKLVTLSGGNPGDVHILAQAYYLGKQYRRAVHLIQKHGFLYTSTENPTTSGTPLAGEGSRKSRQPSSKGGMFQRQHQQEAHVDKNVRFVLLAVQCLIESGQYEEAQNVLENVLEEPDIDRLRRRAQAIESNPSTGDVNTIACLCLLRGKVYETLDNRPRAAQWYKIALFCDIYCYEAFNALIDNQLRPSEERQLMSELNRLGAFDGDAGWLAPVYASRLSKFDYGQTIDARFRELENVVAAPSSTDTYIDPQINNLGQDLDCAADKAECLHQQHDAQGAYQVTRRIRLQDPYHLPCIKVHLTSLVELKRKSELFHTAHKLVDAYPKNAISWFAVGCYYYSIAKYDAARRFFHKATNMDPSLAVAWLGFGHAFAAQDESDQAMAAYRTAARLFTGCHLPVLCTAIEYLRTNNVTLAEQFCRQAKAMCSTDPLVLNELGVVHYRQQRYQQAVDCFQEALKLCRHQPESLRHAWEPAMFNLGHSYRKLGRYSEAIQHYENALSYSPKEASTYSALGITYHLQGRLEEAIQHYHNALGLKPEDTFSSEMLDKALTESYNSSTFDPIPPQETMSSSRLFHSDIKVFSSS